MTEPAGEPGDGGKQTAGPIRWHLQGHPDHSYTGEQAWYLLHRRLDWASWETWFESSEGRLLAVTTNGDRAMVMLLAGPGDPGEHLVDPRADGESGGYALANGQIDVYDDHDTVPFEAAGRAVWHLIDHGVWPDGVSVEYP